MYCRISLNRLTVAATGPHIMCMLSSLCRNLHDDSVFLKLKKKVWNSFGHASVSGETANSLSKCQLVSFKCAPLTGMGDGALIGLLHVTPKTHLPVFRPTHFRFASGARVIYLPLYLMIFDEQLRCFLFLTARGAPQVIWRPPQIWRNGRLNARA